MNIYLVERTDDRGWDEYLSGVVSAECEEEALQIVKGSLIGDNPPVSWDGAEIFKVGVALDDEAKVIHSHFRAG